jgi:hypothetical protein
MVDLGGAPWLVHRGGLLAWTPGGYLSRPVELPAAPVPVITPRATVATLAAGYRPVLHPSAMLRSAGVTERALRAAGCPGAGGTP